jgi:ribose transport system ATP-binding protein
MELLSLKNITKEYPGVRALDNVSISFEKGEVHALIGENGAGKSTFIKTLSGAIRPTSGTIEFEGKTYDHLEPRQAIDLGIAVVYQELIQFEAMSVADNIFLGVKDEKSGLILNDKQRCEKTKELLEAFDCSIDPRTLIRDLSIANRQIVELTKAMVRNAKVVVMDEPTAAITLAEQEKLYTLVKQLKSNGVMAKKVLGISFGRKMSNCDVMVKQALMECEKEGCEVAFLRADDMNITNCNGCIACTVGMMIQQHR